MLRLPEEDPMHQPSASGNRPSASTLIAVALIVLLIVVTVVASLTVLQLPDPVTDQGEKIHLLYQPVLVISMIVFVLVTAGIIWAIFRFKRRSSDEMPEQIHGSSTLEALWTIIPVLILVGLFIPALLLVIDLKTPPSEDDADLTVEAVAHQWWWEFIYPDERIRVQQTPPDYEDLTPPALVVPVDKTVRILVRSTDVVHSFYAPRTLYKIQAIPGNVNIMHFKVEKTGTYYGQCYQFCGLRHSDMLFVLDARSDSEYRQWVQQTRTAQGVSTPNDQAAGAGSGGVKSE
jgi:cytochrome c oxidase subunit 2